MFQHAKSNMEPVSAQFERVSGALTRIFKIAEQRLAPECRPVQAMMPKFWPQRPRAGRLTAGNVAPFPRCRI
jgi:hypothetical protein